MKLKILSIEAKIGLLKKIKKVKFILQDFKDFTLSTNSWIFHIPFIILTFFVCDFEFQEKLISIFNFNFYKLFKIHIDFGLSQSIIDPRIVNISAVFSISFIIIGFLINNLQKHNEDTHGMIYSNIKLFPILYLSLTVIGCLIVISLLRNTFNPNTFINMITWGTFLIIIILFLIGYLFKKVILHIKPKNIYEFFFIEIKKVAERVQLNYNVKRNRKKADRLKLSLEEQLLSASRNGDTESLKYILSVYEKICLLNI